MPPATIDSHAHTVHHIHIAEQEHLNEVMSDSDDLNSNFSDCLTNNCDEGVDGQEDEDGVDGDGGDDQPDLEPGGDWHPFRSRVHAQLVLLFHSSHRRNVDLVTFRSYMHVLKVSFLKLFRKYSYFYSNFSVMSLLVNFSLQWMK